MNSYLRKATAASIVAAVAIATTVIATAGAPLTGQATALDAPSAEQLEAPAPSLVADQLIATSASAARTATATYRVQSINIKSNPLMPARYVKADVARAVSRGSEVIFLQEIEPKYYKDAVKAAQAPKGKGTWHVAALNREVPILYRTGGDSPWVYKGAGQQLMHSGKAHVSPNRYISWVILENKNTHARTAFMNTHMISGAWTGKHSFPQWRKKMWSTHFAKMSATITKLHKAGDSVVFGGDFNRTPLPKPFAAGQRTITLHGIDKIGYVPAKGDIGLAIKQRVTVGGFHSDHDAKVTTFTVNRMVAANWEPAPTKPTQPAPVQQATASGATHGGAADPDMLQAPNGKYYTYSTKMKVPAGCAGAGKTYWVPLRVTASANLAGACPVKDAMPGGPGRWAYRGKGAIVWAPSAVHFNGRWILYYAASKKGTASASSQGHVCLGKAYASSPAGPFKDGGEVACPGGGRWALDPDAFVAGGKLFLVYRDDAVTTGADTGISGVQMNGAGAAIWSTRHTLLTSRNISWDTKGTSGGAHIVENPSMAYVNGAYRLFFSGNNWNSKRYAVGLANCGSSPVNNKCSMSGSTSRPWFGYRGAGGINPLHVLPANHPGPGGLSVFKTNSGAAKVIWHWYPGGPRPAITGSLTTGLRVT